MRALLPLARRARAWRNRGPRLTRYEPTSMLSRRLHPVTRASVPVVDVHAHLGRWLTSDGSWMAPDVGALLDTMDQCNLAVLVNLDGRWGDELEANLARYDRSHPERFMTFCHVDWALLDTDDGVSEIVRSLRDSVRRRGAGIKVLARTSG